MRTSFMITGEGIGKGKITGVHLIDVAPTLAAVMGAEKVPFSGDPDSGHHGGGHEPDHKQRIQTSCPGGTERLSDHGRDLYHGSPSLFRAGGSPGQTGVLRDRGSVRGYAPDLQYDRIYGTCDRSESGT